MTPTINKPRIVPLKDITVDRNIQPRLHRNETKEQEYAEIIKAGGTFPPVVAFNDGAKIWLSSGFTRRDAHELAGKRGILCEIREGTWHDAWFFALGANKHGEKLTIEEKREGVRKMLLDPALRHLSDRAIALHIDVSNTFVGNMRRGLIEEPTVNVDSQMRIGRDGRAINTANIGRSITNNETDSDDTQEEGDTVLNDDESNTSTPPNDATEEGGKQPQNDTQTDAQKGTDATQEGTENDTTAATTPAAPDAPAGTTTGTKEQGKPKQDASPTAAERAKALPLYIALSGYGHAGYLMLSAATFWYDMEGIRNKCAYAQSRNAPPHATGTLFDELKAYLRIGDPIEWEGCPACKGSMRVGDGQKCESCKGGFTTHRNEGVSAETVNAYRQEHSEEPQS